MKTIVFGLIIASFILAANAAQITRAKRYVSLWKFSRMIKCETGKSAYWDYDGYGCWCGSGGTGSAVDATDRCCRTHDECYERLVNDGTCKHNDWKRLAGSYSRSGCSGCSPRNTGCGKGLCYCDGAAARCFKRALSTYDSSYLGHRAAGNC